MKRILWLASWYPNEAEPFSGDFIKRHAEAVSIFQPLKVIYVGKLSPKSVTQKTEIKNIENKAGSLKEYLLYYPSSGNKNGILSRSGSLLSYFKIHLAFIKQLRKSNELPDLVHVHVAMKAGLIALYLKWKYKIPYMITEHWTGYYPQARDSLFKKSFLTRYLTRQILKNAVRFLPVSEELGNQISRHLIQIPFQKIPNVVNTGLFFPAETKPGNKFRFIHISSLIEQKNPEGILRSFMELLKQGFDAELFMVGPFSTMLAETIPVKFRDYIQFTGEISYDRVAAELRKSSALVMFSFYENMPCVILEALCTGIPVISTRVGGIPEVIHPDNGILIESGKEIQLFEAMKEMIKNYDFYENKIISRQASEAFSYETIGKEISDVYDSVLKNISHQ
jgi:glycosyltransferase involved in cell wall biosynthesis